MEQILQEVFGMPEIPMESLGYLVVHVTTARGSIPLEGAAVHIRTNEDADTTPRADILYATTTNRDGNTERIPLAAPPREATMKPSEVPPFSTYHLEVRREGYGMQSFVALPIFSGITAVQPVDLIPLPEDGSSNPLRPADERFYENSPADL